MKETYKATNYNNITVYSTVELTDKQLTALTDPILSGRADAVFGRGCSDGSLWARLVTLAANILNGTRLKSLACPCLAVSGKFTGLTPNAGLPAAILAGAKSGGLKYEEARVDAPAAFGFWGATLSVCAHSALILYGIVGLLSTIAEWLVFWLCDNLTPVSVFTSTAVSYVLSTVFNWYLAREWAFRGKARGLSDVLPTVIVAALALGINELLMLLFTGPLHIANFTSKVISTILVFAFNYLARKKVIYK